MSYFSPAETTLPVVEEITPSGTALRVVIAQGGRRFILDGVVDFHLGVGDEVRSLPRYKTRIELRQRWSPFDEVGMDDDD